MKKFISTFVFLLTLTGLSVIFATCRKEKCKEKKDATCGCTLQYDPVCGCNGKTYGNSCDAECSGITEFTKGECK